MKSNLEVIKTKLSRIAPIIDKIIEHMNKESLDDLAFSPEELTEILPMLLFCMEMLEDQIKE